MVCLNQIQFATYFLNVQYHAKMRQLIYIPVPPKFNNRHFASQQIDQRTTQQRLNLSSKEYFSQRDLNSESILRSTLVTLYLQCLSSGLTSDFTEESGLKPRGLRGLDLENVVPSREKRIIVLCDQYALLHTQQHNVLETQP